LKHVEDMILQQEEELGIASVELTQLRSDLREALALFAVNNEQNGMSMLLSILYVFITL
jgi:hypothetical protein